MCDCARPGAHQVCLLDYGCQCDFFTIDDDLFLHEVDKKTLDDYKKLLAGLKKFELPMKKAGQCFKALSELNNIPKRKMKYYPLCILAPNYAVMMVG